MRELKEGSVVLIRLQVVNVVPYRAADHQTLAETFRFHHSVVRSCGFFGSRHGEWLLERVPGV